MAVELEGLTPRIAARPTEEGRRGGRAHALWLSLIADGRVVASDDPRRGGSSRPAAPPPRSSTRCGSIPPRHPATARGPQCRRATGASSWRGWPTQAPTGSSSPPRACSSWAPAQAPSSRCSCSSSACGAGAPPPGQDPRSYFLISVLPSSSSAARTGATRCPQRGSSADGRDPRARGRADLEASRPTSAGFASLGTYGQVYSADFSLYVSRDVRATSLRGLVDAEAPPPRLPPPCSRPPSSRAPFAVRDGTFAGRTVRVGYAPILDARPPVGHGLGPLIYDSARRRAAGRRDGQRAPRRACSPSCSSS
jgi:hypothetical protein